MTFQTVASAPELTCRRIQQDAARERCEQPRSIGPAGSFSPSLATTFVEVCGQWSGRVMCSDDVRVTALESVHDAIRPAQELSKGWIGELWNNTTRLWKCRELIDSNDEPRNK